MKIIDLLNKIANGEEVPKEIKFCDKFRDEKFEYIFDKGQSDYERVDKLEYLFNDHFMTEWLNEKVEIIEENKEIEEIGSWYEVLPTESKETQLKELNHNFNVIFDRLDNLIKTVNKLKKGK